MEALFAHAPGASPGGGAGGGACLLHFLPGDNITLLISEPRDGWHYGQNERTGRYVPELEFPGRDLESLAGPLLNLAPSKTAKRLNDARQAASNWNEKIRNTPTSAVRLFSTRLQPHQHVHVLVRLQLILS